MASIFDRPISMKSLARQVLRTLGGLGVAPGYYYQFVDSWGAHLQDAGPLLAHLPNGCAMNCDLGDHVMRQIYFFGAYEPVESYLFTRLLRPGMVAMDVGANVGQYTLLASTAVGERGRVHSFEPIPSNFERARAHVAMNSLGNVHLTKAALWNEDGAVALDMPAGMTGNAGAYSVALDERLGPRTNATAIRLDSYVAERGIERLDVVKMDIEGAEPLAIAGGIGALTRFRPTILMEINRGALARMNQRPGDLWTQMSGLGYRAFRIGWSAATSGEIPDLEGIEQCNVLFHVDELPAEITSDWDLKGVLRWARGPKT